jgi:hypothetical protein
MLTGKEQLEDPRSMYVTLEGEKLASAFVSTVDTLMPSSS